MSVSVQVWRDTMQQDENGEESFSALGVVLFTLINTGCLALFFLVRLRLFRRGVSTELQREKLKIL